MGYDADHKVNQKHNMYNAKDKDSANTPSTLRRDG